MKRYNVSANRYNGSDGYAGTRAAGKRVQVQRVFSQKKTDRPFSNPYPFTRLYPGTGTYTVGTGHGYTGTDCTRAGFSKPLPPPHRVLMKVRSRQIHVVQFYGDLVESNI
jgi:hypothetical protein